MKKLILTLFVCFLILPLQVFAHDGWSGGSIRDHSDVDASTAPADGEALLWDDTEELYVPGAVGGGAIEGTAVLSTGEGGGTKYLREDGDGTSSWQTPAGAGDLLADGSVPMTANWEFGNYDLTLKAITGDGAFTTTNTVSGEQLTSTDDINATDRITAGGPIISTNSYLFSDADNAGLTTGETSDIWWIWGTNGAEDDLATVWFNAVNVAGNESHAYVFTPTKLNATPDFNDYYSPTLALLNNATADANDYAGVIIGGRTTSDVTAAWYFDFFATTGSMDAAVDAVATELGPIFRFGNAGSATTGHSVTAGGVLFEDDIEVDGATWLDGAVVADGNLSVGNATTTAGVLTLLEDDDDGSNFASFMVPALGANTVYTLPPDDGDNNDVLATNGAGVLSWTTAGAGDFLADGTVSMTGNFNINTQAIEDANSNELVTFITGASAVNNIQITNSAAGDGVKLTAVGGDTNIDLHLEPKGIGIIRLEETLPSTAGQSLAEIIIDVDSSAQVSTSEYHAILVETTGTPAGEFAALGTVGKVDPIHQHIATFATPSQTEFAGKKITAGTVWVDGDTPTIGENLDANEIFVVNDDEIYFGGAAQFDEVEVIMGTGATKNVNATFWYNTAADTWTQFFPDDGTDGFQQSGDIIWLLSGITGLWTGNGDPGGADTTAGYWIKIIRTRVADPGTPTPTTIKIGLATTYFWDKTGAIDALSVEGDTLTEGGNAVPNATDDLSFFSATSFANLNTNVSDKTLVNEEDAITLDALLTAGLNLSVKNGAVDNASISIYEDSDSGGNFIKIKGVATAADLTWILPATNGTAGQILEIASVDGDIITLEWDDDGGAGGGGGITNLTLPVQSAKLTGSFVLEGDATQGAGIDAGDGNWRLLFDDTVDEAGVWQFVMPDNYASDPVLDIHFSMTSGEANEVQFEGSIMCYTPTTDSADVGTPSFAAIDEGSATTVAATAGRAYKQVITLTDDSCAVGDMVWIYVSTDADDAVNDDATGDRECIGVEFGYTGS